MEENFTLKEVYFCLLKRWKIIFFTVIAFLLISIALSFFIIDPKYEAKTKLFIGKQEVNSQESDYSSSDITMYQKLMKTYAEVLETPDLIEKSLKDVNMEYDEEKVEHILENLKVEPRTDTQILEVKFQGKEALETLKITEIITEAFINEAKDLIPNGNIKIIQRPKLPKEPISPNKVKIISIAFLGGLIISVGLVFLAEYLEGTFKSREEIENLSKLPIIGTIPNFDEV